MSHVSAHSPLRRKPFIFTEVFSTPQCLESVLRPLTVFNCRHQLIREKQQPQQQQIYVSVIVGICYMLVVMANMLILFLGVQCNTPFEATTKLQCYA